jgi:hypothetical protein
LQFYNRQEFVAMQNFDICDSCGGLIATAGIGSGSEFDF